MYLLLQYLYCTVVYCTFLYCTVPAAAVVLGGPGGEGDACGEVAALLVLVVALLGRHRREPRAAPAPPEHSELFQIMNIQWAMNG